MTVRRANIKDIPAINHLLGQVLEIHHKGRPDLFKGNAKKYTDSQLQNILSDENRPVFVASDEDDDVLGYAFCVIKQQINHNILTDIKTLYIDDLCVDEESRGQHIGRQLFDFVYRYAKEIGCYNLTLNVWECNTAARKFYEKCGLIPQKTEMETIL